MSRRTALPEAPATIMPLVTFALFTYNQDQYVEDAVKAALAQTYSNLEIIISDDHSTDSTFETIQSTVSQLSGAHTPIIRQNLTNLGFAAHINAVMEIASGELIVVAAGDDISFPNRVSTLVNHWISTGKESGSIFSRFRTIDAEGKITRHGDLGSINRFSLASRDMQNTLGITVGSSGCTQAWTKDLFEIFGHLDPRILHEDITIPLRALLNGSVTYLPDELVLYRITTGTLSRASIADYRARFAKMARYWQGRVANYEQYARDSAEITACREIKDSDLEWLNLLVKNQADLARLNYRFFSGRFRDQIRSILDSSDNVGLIRRLKLLGLALFPCIYGMKYPLKFSQTMISMKSLNTHSQKKCPSISKNLTSKADHLFPYTSK